MRQWMDRRDRIWILCKCSWSVWTFHALFNSFFSSTFKADVSLEHFLCQHNCSWVITRLLDILFVHPSSIFLSLLAPISFCNGVFFLVYFDQIQYLLYLIKFSMMRCSFKSSSRATWAWKYFLQGALEVRCKEAMKHVDVAQGNSTLHDGQETVEWKFLSFLHEDFLVGLKETGMGQVRQGLWASIETALYCQSE